MEYEALSGLSRSGIREMWGAHIHQLSLDILRCAPVRNQGVGAYVKANPYTDLAGAGDWIFENNLEDLSLAPRPREPSFDDLLKMGASF